MDKGRIMDNAQNNNARYVDNFGGSGKTSTKVMAPPGGKSSFSLGWNEPEVQQQQPKRNFNNMNNQQSQQQGKNNNNYDNNYNDQQQQRNNNQASNQAQKQQQSNVFHNDVQPVKTSVRVKQAPGGNSQITFG